MSFYFGLSMQLAGFSMVGLCLYAGITSGDYGKLELFQFIFGTFLFYFGTLFKNKARG